MRSTENNDVLDQTPRSAAGFPASHRDSHFSRNKDYFDEALVGELALLFAGNSICDFGCGMGKYVRWLRNRGFDCDGFDGNPNTSELTRGECRSLNLAEHVQLARKYDAVLCLEVGERIPKEYAPAFLDNITTHATKMIVLSWAIPDQEGDGHVNCRTNSYVIFQLWKRGYRFDPIASMTLRANCSLDWFKQTLMAFSKSRRLYSQAEFRTVRKIAWADIERFKRNNRSNSSFFAALAGKGVRWLISGRDLLTRYLNRIRLFGYDAARQLRLGPRPANQKREVGSSRVFPVCFTCGKHFRLVRLALVGLNRRDIPIGQISIYMDKGDPLSELQRQQLQAESSHPIAFRLTKYSMASWGPKVQLSELEAYREVANGMSPYDYLVKFDSDVLFLSDRTFRFVLQSNAGAVGTTVSKLHDSERSEEYMQGGCYFIRAKELEEIFKISVAPSSLAPTKWGEIPEDQFFSNLLKRCGVRPVYSDFLYFEPILIASRTKESDLIAKLKTLPPTADVLHFEGNQFDRVDRSNMKTAAEYFFGRLPPVVNPYQ